MRPFGRIAIAAALAALSTGASAEDHKVGAWSVGLTRERAGTFAATGTGRGGRLGQYCYPEQGVCLWILTNDVACDADSHYPVVANSDGGAVVLDMVCLGIEGQAAYAFADFDAIDGIVRRARTVALAIPTSNGRFQLSRFSLDGATRAVALMRKTAEAMGGKPDAAAEPDLPAGSLSF